MESLSHLIQKDTIHTRGIFLRENSMDKVSFIILVNSFIGDYQEILGERYEGMYENDDRHDRAGKLTL